MHSKEEATILVPADASFPSRWVTVQENPALPDGSAQMLFELCNWIAGFVKAMNELSRHQQLLEKMASEEGTSDKEEEDEDEKEEQEQEKEEDPEPRPKKMRRRHKEEESEAAVSMSTSGIVSHSGTDRAVCAHASPKLEDTGKTRSNIGCRLTGCQQK